MDYTDSRITNSVLEGISSIVQFLKRVRMLSKYFELYYNDLPPEREHSLKVTHMKQRIAGLAFSITGGISQRHSMRGL